MKQQDVFNKIGGIIKELNDQFKYLEADPGKINELELELFVANTHFLADHAEVLRKLNTQAHPVKTEEKKEIKTDEKYFEPFVQQPEDTQDDQPVPQIDIASDTPGDDYSYIRQEPEIIRHELEIDESWADDEDEELNEPVESIAAKEPARPKYISTKSMVKKPDEDVVTVNQKMSAQLGHKADGEPVKQSVIDLKSAITLNDKLLYVKDLFNGYSLAYSEAIEILNRFKTFEEADTYLKSNYAAKNKWEDKQDTSEKFYALLKRRYT